MTISGDAFSMDLRLNRFLISDTCICAAAAATSTVQPLLLF